MRGTPSHAASKRGIFGRPQVWCGEGSGGWDCLGGGCREGKSGSRGTKTHHHPENSAGIFFCLDARVCALVCYVEDILAAAANTLFSLSFISCAADFCYRVFRVLQPLSALWQPCSFPAPRPHRACWTLSTKKARRRVGALKA